MDGLLVEAELPRIVSRSVDAADAHREWLTPFVLGARRVGEPEHALGQLQEAWLLDLERRPGRVVPVYHRGALLVREHGGWAREHEERILVRAGAVGVA